MEPIERRVLCPTCSGNGSSLDPSGICETCEGVGVIPESVADLLLAAANEETTHTEFEKIYDLVKNHINKESGHVVESGNTRRRVLEAAESLVNGDRNVQYGDPNSDFRRTAAMWSAYLSGNIERNGGVLDLNPHDVAAMMILLKVSRLCWSPDKEDTWVDIAGYAACGMDCAESNAD